MWRHCFPMLPAKRYGIGMPPFCIRLGLFGSKRRVSQLNPIVRPDITDDGPWLRPWWCFTEAQTFFQPLVASYETKRFCPSQRRKQSCDLVVVSFIYISCFFPTSILPYFEHLSCLLTERVRTAGIDMKMANLYLFSLGRESVPVACRRWRWPNEYTV